MGDIDKHLEQLRVEYSKKTLSRMEAHTDPIEQFAQWFKEGMAADLQDLNVAHLSTVAQGKPSTRVILLRSYSERGFVFYTNYNSSKGRAIAENPNVSLNIFWWPLERQIRIEGVATKIPFEESVAYFNGRPRDSQIGAWASDQSEMIEDRRSLDEKYAEMESRFEGKDIPCPENWGGYIVTPTSIEFWQGRESRLHDRLRYDIDNGKAVVRRLQP